MGILDRMSRVVKSNLNDLVGRMQDPGKEIDQLVADMEQQLREGRQEIVSAAAAEKRLAGQEQQLADEAAQWERRATMALKAGDETLAREALGRKQDVDARLAALRRDRTQQAAYAAELKEQMAKFELRLQEIKGKAGTLKARAKAARTGSSVGTGSAGAFAEFDRLAGQVDDFEVQGEAEAELAMSGKEEDARVAAKFAELDKHGGVDDALAELKRKLDQNK